MMCEQRELDVLAAHFGLGVHGVRNARVAPGALAWQGLPQRPP